MLRSVSPACIVAAVALWGEHAAAQIPPETSLYELIDIVPPPAPVTCGCVVEAFALPAFRPSPWGGGPAAPDARMTRGQEREPSKQLVEERERLPHVADDGFAGNGNASISVAMHLRASSLAAGGDTRTEEEATRWMYLAAVQEHPDAFVFLGYRYQRGDGVPQSDATAAYWFQHGAVRGNKTAMVALGLRYAAGRGVPQDFAAAVYWWRQAAETALASRFLGDAYACGLGVDHDPKLALREYTKAADRGETSSNIQLGRLYLGGCGESDDKAAAKALRVAADAGHPDAQIMLSELLLQGRGVEIDAAEAYYWARIAERRLGEGDAQRVLASGRVKAAAGRMSRDAIAAAETMVEAMIAAAAKQMR